MKCAAAPWLSNDEFIADFNHRSATLRVPLSGSIDLTHRCNLGCIHCYLGSGDGRKRTRPNEMTGEELFSIIDEVADAGCLFFLITGGEPLIREDFPRIYRHARERGLLITVFTNGTLVSDTIAELFAELPPYCVEISLYGASAATYERITGVAGSYEKCISGITRLLDRGINVRIKTILMTVNSGEFPQMEKMASRFGVKFRFDAAIFPRLNGDRTPLNLRVPPEYAIDREFSSAERSRSWGEYYRRSAVLPKSDRLYNCGAGVTGFHIDPCGNLQPCLMATNYRHSLVKGGFAAGWRNIATMIGEKRAGSALGCSHCDIRHLCGFCPAFSRWEKGAEDRRSEYLCAMGNRRYQLIKYAETDGGSDAH